MLSKVTGSSFTVNTIYVVLSAKLFDLDLDDNCQSPTGGGILWPPHSLFYSVKYILVPLLGGHFESVVVN